MNPMDIDSREKHANRILSEIKKMQFGDMIGDYENHFLGEVYNAYLFSFSDRIKEYIKVLLDKLEIGENFDVGDMDTLVVKVSEDTLTIKDMCGTGTFTNFIVNMTPRKLHVRNLYDDDCTDYIEGNQYINRPNLKWYKDREFNFEYVEKLQMTTLGGIYGDMRDSNYVFSFLANEFSSRFDDPYNYNKVCGNTLGNHRSIGSFMRNLDSIIYDLDEMND